MAHTKHQGPTPKSSPHAGRSEEPGERTRLPASGSWTCPKSRASRAHPPRYPASPRRAHDHRPSGVVCWSRVRSGSNSTRAARESCRRAEPPHALRLPARRHDRSRAHGRVGGKHLVAPLYHHPHALRRRRCAWRDGGRPLATTLGLQGPRVARERKPPVHAAVHSLWLVLAACESERWQLCIGAIVAGDRPGSDAVGAGPDAPPEQVAPPPSGAVLGMRL